MIKNNKSGKKAPNFILPNQYDEIINLSKIKNKFIVLFFYPKDDTPGCTIESIDFSKLNKNFIKLNAKVYGISKDDQKSHCKFIDKYNLKVDLLSDNKLKTIKAYKVWGAKKGKMKQKMKFSQRTPAKTSASAFSWSQNHK